jgi:hypothetical protein
MAVLEHNPVLGFYCLLDGLDSNLSLTLTK